MVFLSNGEWRAHGLGADDMCNHFPQLAHRRHYMPSPCWTYPTKGGLPSIFDICGSLRVKLSVFLREVEKLSGFELPSKSDKGLVRIRIKIRSSPDTWKTAGFWAE
jgi:hypothetical protein